MRIRNHDPSIPTSLDATVTNARAEAGKRTRSIVSAVLAYHAGLILVIYWCSGSLLIVPDEASNRLTVVLGLTGIPAILVIIWVVSLMFKALRFKSDIETKAEKLARRKAEKLGKQSGSFVAAYLVLSIMTASGKWRAVTDTSPPLVSPVVYLQAYISHLSP